MSIEDFKPANDDEFYDAARWNHGDVTESIKKRTAWPSLRTQDATPPRPKPKPRLNSHLRAKFQPKAKPRFKLNFNLNLNFNLKFKRKRKLKFAFKPDPRAAEGLRIRNITRIPMAPRRSSSYSKSKYANFQKRIKKSRLAGIRNLLDEIVDDTTQANETASKINELAAKLGIDAVMSDRTFTDDEKAKRKEELTKNSPEWQELENKYEADLSRYTSSLNDLYDQLQALNESKNPEDVKDIASDFNDNTNARKYDLTPPQQSLQTAALRDLRAKISKQVHVIFRKIFDLILRQNPEVTVEKQRQQMAKQPPSNVIKFEMRKFDM